MRHSGVVTAALTVGALACGGESPADSPLAASSQNATVSAASTLVATAASPDEIDLAWQPGSSAVSGWQVHRSTSASGVFALVATLPATARSYANLGLSAATSYCYKVRSFRTNGSTSYSSFIGPECATTFAPPPPPPPAIAAPSGVRGVPVRADYTDQWTSGLQVTWTDNSSNEDGFRLERSTTAGGPWTLATTTAANGTSAFQYGIREEQVCFRVTAFNSAVASSPSGAACTTPPANPTNLVAAATTAGIDLVWSDNSAIEDGYRVSRADASGTWAELATLPANATSYSDGAVTADTTYAYRVQALKDGGASDWSNQAVSVVPTTPPAAPLGLVAMYWADMEGYGWLYFDASWTDGSTNEAGFRIEVSADGVSGWMTMTTTQANDPHYFYKYDLLLLIGASWGECYRVVAFNSLGDSPPSNVFCTGWGGAPTNLVATAVDRQTIDLSWTSTAVFASGYAISRATSFEGPWEAASCTADASATTCRDTGLAAGQHYVYIVAATYPQNWNYDFYNDSWVEVSTLP